MLNREQREYVEYLNSLPVDQKCGCGWYTREDCIKVHCNGGARPEDAEAAKWFKLGVQQTQTRYMKKLDGVLDRLVKDYGSALPDAEQTREITSGFAYYVKSDMENY